jgi:sugar phosphate isomerase/epimerase
MIENHGGLTKNGDMSAKIVKLIDKHNVRLVYDPANYIKSGADPAHALIKTVKYIEHVHVKDIIDNQFCAVGEGIVPWKDILDLLKACGWEGYFSIEYEGVGNKEAGLILSYRNFKRLYDYFFIG